MNYIIIIGQIFLFPNTFYFPMFARKKMRTTIVVFEIRQRKKSIGQIFF